jgi:hypothetical protein
MAQPLRLEVFELPDTVDTASVLMPEDLEDLRLSAYERGYIAGWDDATGQADTERSAREARVAARIEALTFGYHEARAAILAGMEPLLAALVAQVLPAAARASVIPLVVELMLPLAAARAERPLILRVPSGMAEDFRTALAGLALPPLTITEAAELSELEAEIVADADETRVDLQTVLSRIEAALATFHATSHPETRRA